MGRRTQPGKPRKNRKRERERSPKRSRRPRSEAARADLYDLYERAVQEPEADIRMIERIFRRQSGRPPRLLREDFCGTAIFACDWVKAHPENRAWGIDLDPAPLESGRRRHVAKLTPEQAGRLKLIEGNVLDVGHEKVDVTVAFNFSYFLFRTREELGRYFRVARQTLREDGLLFLDMYGGADSQRVQEERRELDDFDYFWEQHRFDPITHAATNYIHFAFPDGSERLRAFRYDWRLWTLPEIRDLLAECGFGESEVYWEGTDRRTNEGNGIFTRREHAPDDPAWIAYLVARV